MALDRLTKITGPGIKTDTNWEGNNANFTGVTTTASSFNVGVTTIHSRLIEAHNIKSTGIITATGAHFSGNVSIAGTLTYEDVTNIDSVGIITAPAVDIDDFLDVGSNIKLGNAGVITATSFVGSGAALTGIDATSIKDSGGNVKVQAQASGAIYTGIHTFNSDLDVDGHTNLDNLSIAGVTTIANDTEFKIGSNANNKLPFKIKQDTGGGNVNYIDSRFTYFRSHAIRMYDQDNTSHQVAYFWNNQIGLYASNVETLRVAGSGVNILNGDLTVGRDIDVDGHTNLDNVSIAGVTTFSDTVHVGTGVTILSNGRAEFTGFTTFAQGLNIPFYKNLTIGNSLYGKISYPTGGSALEIQALNQIKMKCWDGNSHETGFHMSGVGGQVKIGGGTMGNNGSRQPELSVTGHTTQTITMRSSDGSNLTERFRLSQSGFNFTGLSTHTGNFDLDGDLDVDGHTNLDNVSIAGVTTMSGDLRIQSTSPSIYFTDTNIK